MPAQAPPSVKTPSPGLPSGAHTTPVLSPGPRGLGIVLGAFALLPKPSSKVTEMSPLVHVVVQSRWLTFSDAAWVAATLYLTSGLGGLLAISVQLGL